MSPPGDKGESLPPTLPLLSRLLEIQAFKRGEGFQAGHRPCPRLSSRKNTLPFNGNMLRAPQKPFSIVWKHVSHTTKGAAAIFCQQQIATNCQSPFFLEF